MDPVTPTPSLRVTAAPRPAALMRLVTIVVALLLVVLGILAAHHAQTTQGESGHPVLTELATAHQPIADSAAGAPEISAAEHIAMGLAAGCIALIVCCALGFAVLAARAWRAELFRRLGSAAQLLRATVIAATPALLGAGARPSLIVLSISRS